MNLADEAGAEEIRQGTLQSQFPDPMKNRPLEQADGGEAHLRFGRHEFAQAPRGSDAGPSSGGTTPPCRAGTSPEPLPSSGGDDPIGGLAGAEVTTPTNEGRRWLGRAHLEIGASTVGDQGSLSLGGGPLEACLVEEPSQRDRDRIHVPQDFLHAPSRQPTPRLRSAGAGPAPDLGHFEGSAPLSQARFMGRLSR